ncbi:MAG TPA: hypothetical protein VF541_23595 [Longimicrobium sp.]
MTNPRILLRSEPDCSRPLDGFVRRLAETAVWCDTRADLADPSGSLRCEQLRPPLLSRDPFAAVRGVGTRRETLLRLAGQAPAGPFGGRLLVYFPEANLSDGAAEAASGGWFDVFNTPPWDTWVAFAADDAAPDRSYAGYLIAYAPPVFLDACASGIWANPEQCLTWLEDADVAFRDLLRRHAPELL